MSIFNEKETFRTMLLNRDISCEEIVKMKKEGFMSAESKAEMEKATEDKL